MFLTTKHNGVLITRRVPMCANLNFATALSGESFVAANCAKATSRLIFQLLLIRFMKAKDGKEWRIGWVIKKGVNCNLFYNIGIGAFT